MKKFDKDNARLTKQFDEIDWICDSGLDKKDLIKEYESIMENNVGLSKTMMKANTYKLISTKARIAIDKDDIFQDKLFDANLLGMQREEWERDTIEKYLKEETKKTLEAGEIGAYKVSGDYGHTSPNSKLLLKIGFKGLYDRAKEASAQKGITEKQKDFYNSCMVTMEAAMTYIMRLAKAILPYNKDNAAALENIAKGAPTNIYEAMQLLIAYFFFHEYVGKTRVRTLGRIDVLLYPFYVSDIESGTYTKEEIKEMLKFFLNKFWSADVPFGLPICLGGIDESGNEVTNEVSYLLVETYRELNIYSPKIHIRVSDKTPPSFVKLVLDAIRGGISSFVIVNDNVAIKSLVDVGIAENDAHNYVPIGCYEPAVWGVEIGCTGNGGVNIAKAVEFVVTNGVDLKTNTECGLKTGKIDSFDEFVCAIKKQIAFMSEKAIRYVCGIEKHYDKINPDPVLSSMYDHSIESGTDVYEGGAEYNNSSLYYWGLATLVDSVAAVKKIVYEDNDVIFDEFCEILKNNWEGYEHLRQKALKECEKYGNNHSFTDKFTKEISDYVSQISNNHPNGRGGVFKTALFTIDNYVPLGEKTMATPDGRKSGDIISKNLCATVGMDKNGITALINSVTNIDMSKFPTGTVLDVVFHPSVVRGDSGLEAFYAILKTYFLKGGFAMHGNVFDAQLLRKEQKEPEKYSTLQVRVCGWNAYFVNLSIKEQEAFIRQCENNE